MMLRRVNCVSHAGLLRMKPNRRIVFALALSSCACSLHAQQRSAQHNFNTPHPSVAPKTPGPHFPVLLDNSRVRVLRVDIAPNAETPMLSDNYDYVLVELK